MRFLFVVFMLLLFPLQMTWAAASAYCQHETGRASHHFGHHVHQHVAQLDQDADHHKKSLPKASFHADCGYCHANGTLFAPIAASSPVLTFQKITVNTHRVFFPASVPPSLPEKPNWSFVV